MIRIILVSSLFVFQTGCAAFEAYRIVDRGPVPQTFADNSIYSQVREAQKKNAKQWAEWDSKYVSDDVILIEIRDKNGKILATGTGR